MAEILFNSTSKVSAPIRFHLERFLEAFRAPPSSTPSIYGRTESKFAFRSEQRCIVFFSRKTLDCCSPPDGPDNIRLLMRHPPLMHHVELRARSSWFCCRFFMGPSVLSSRHSSLAKLWSPSVILATLLFFLPAVACLCFSNC